MSWITGNPVDSEGWGAAQVAMVTRLLPQIRQFVHVRQALVQAEPQNATVTALLDNPWIGVVNLDCRRRIPPGQWPRPRHPAPWRRVVGTERGCCVPHAGRSAPARRLVADALAHLPALSRSVGRCYCAARPCRRRSWCTSTPCPFLGRVPASPVTLCAQRERGQSQQSRPCGDGRCCRTFAPSRPSRPPQRDHRPWEHRDDAG